LFENGNTTLGFYDDTAGGSPTVNPAPAAFLDNNIKIGCSWDGSGRSVSAYGKIGTSV